MTLKLKLPDCFTSGFCSLDYVIAEGLSIHLHVSTINICNNFFDVFVNRENAFIDQLKANGAVWIEGVLYCYLLDKDNETIESYHTLVYHPLETLNELLEVGNS